MLIVLIENPDDKTTYVVDVTLSMSNYKVITQSLMDEGAEEEGIINDNKFKYTIDPLTFKYAILTVIDPKVTPTIKITAGVETFGNFA